VRGQTRHAKPITRQAHLLPLLCWFGMLSRFIKPGPFALGRQEPPEGGFTRRCTRGCGRPGPNRTAWRAIGVNGSSARDFAAHPVKSQHSGEIMPAEPHEAEWNLDVFDSLFDVYYVQPARRAERRAALNAKLSNGSSTPGPR
jgi:hypothetical protein